MYRILQMRDGKPTTLFHGVDRSRTLPVSEWIQADVKEVHDGSGGTKYMSGFHVMESRQDATDYLRRFEKERPLVVSKVQVGHFWRKKHSNEPVLLAESMMIKPVHWSTATNPLGTPMEIPEEENQKRRSFLSGVL